MSSYGNFGAKPKNVQRQTTLVIGGERSPLPTIPTPLPEEEEVEPIISIAENNEAQIVPTPLPEEEVEPISKEISHSTYREKIAKEILSTEQTFVHGLQTLINVFSAN
jgi:hypothetical protein